jgi:hypothetical protein
VSTGWIPTDRREIEMRVRSLVAAAGIAGLLVAGAPAVAAAADGVVPPGCSAGVRDGNREFVKVVWGACDATVTRPWRLTYRFACSAFPVRGWTEYSLVSPKEREVGCYVWPPSIELQP